MPEETKEEPRTNAADNESEVVIPPYQISSSPRTDIFYDQPTTGRNSTSKPPLQLKKKVEPKSPKRSSSSSSEESASKKSNVAADKRSDSPSSSHSRSHSSSSSRRSSSSSSREDSRRSESSKDEKEDQIEQESRLTFENQLQQHQQSSSFTMFSDQGIGKSQRIQFEPTPIMPQRHPDLPRLPQSNTTSHERQVPPVVMSYRQILEGQNKELLKNIKNKDNSEYFKSQNDSFCMNSFSPAPDMDLHPLDPMEPVPTQTKKKVNISRFIGKMDKEKHAKSGGGSAGGTQGEVKKKMISRFIGKTII